MLEKSRERVERVERDGFREMEERMGMCALGFVKKLVASRGENGVGLGYVGLLKAYCFRRDG